MAVTENEVLEEIRDQLEQIKVPGAREATPANTSADIEVERGAPCIDFDPTSGMTAKAARRSDRYTQFAVCAARQASAEAGIDTGAVDMERLAVLVGTGVGGLKTLEDECRAFIKGGVRAVSPLFVPMMMPNAAAGMIAISLGAHGPGFSVSSACATGSHAIGEAKRMIER